MIIVLACLVVWIVLAILLGWGWSRWHRFQADEE